MLPQPLQLIMPPQLNNALRSPVAKIDAAAMLLLLLLILLTRLRLAPPLFNAALAALMTSQRID
jgi:hypothetical protein